MNAAQRGEGGVFAWLFGALPKQESTITNKAKSIKSQNGFIILKPTLMNFLISCITRPGVERAVGFLHM